MLKEHKIVLEEVVGHMLRDFAFLFTEMASVPDMGLNDSDFIEAVIMAQGDFRARFVLCVASSLSIDIAANILGLDPGSEESVENAEDSVKELLNLISSHVLTRLGGTTAVFNLGVAQSKRISDQSVWMKSLVKQEPVTVLVDGRPLMVWMET